MQVFGSALGPQHPRTLTAARNAHHMRHKIIRLPAAAASAAAPGGGSSALPHVDMGRGSGVPRARNRGARRVLAAGAGGSGGSGSSASSIEHGSDRDSDCSSDSDCSISISSSSGSKAGVQQQRQQRPRDSSKSKQQRRLARGGSMQDRLQAVVRTRHASGQHAVARVRQQPEQLRDYTDLDCLGSGVSRASLEQRQLLAAMQADIQAARAARAAQQMHGPEGVLELQVAAPSPGPAAAAPARQMVRGGLGADATVTPLPKGHTHVSRRKRQGKVAVCSSSVLNKLV
jgi:hypothetical protein